MRVERRRCCVICPAADEEDEQGFRHEAEEGSYEKAFVHSIRPGETFPTVPFYDAASTVGEVGGSNNAVVEGVAHLYHEICKAEGLLPDSPVSAPNSPSSDPNSPFLGDTCPRSVVDAFQQPAPNQNLLENPLDQFTIQPIIDLNVGNYYLSFTNQSLYMLLTFVLVVFLFFVVTKKGGGKSVPNAWQSLVELIYDFVLNLVNEQIGGLSGNVKQKFFPRISVTFTFSLFRNPQGMIPFSFTVTSHFLITLALSFSIFIGITIVGFQRHGLHFFSFLLPAGVPLPLAPFLVLLELISYCFRALSLGIRLFANMMAGHSLVKILSGFAWTMLFLNNIFYFIGDLEEGVTLTTTPIIVDNTF
ncbi:ATP synthase subunit a-like [Hordeum vulgare subsp. vulgare]|uniref:ATP synthase subunit a-like n=1 Tax=Hordeum vulgare subsp. vulgare TaxID=112509 RepID=UPI001D1A35F2|nr:ATP synthase subunit a-like [Hordeum vulgare subsp. vulgare]